MSFMYLRQASFSRGEFSKKLFDRTDLEHYRIALAYCENFIVLRHGGLLRRPPTEFIAEIKDSTKTAWLRPFTFNAEQAYILEFSENNIRVYKDDGVVLDTGTPVDITTTFTETQSKELGYSQSADVLYMAPQAHHPKRLTRWSHVGWNLSDVNFIDGPWEPKNNTANKALPSGDIIANATTTVGFDSTDGINDGDGFTASDVGRLFRWEHPGWEDLNNDGKPKADPASQTEDTTTGQHVAWGQITTVNNTTNIVVLWLGSSGIETTSGITIVNNIQNIHGTYDRKSEGFWLGAYHSTETYPQKVAFYSERIGWGRSDLKPQTIAFSQSAGFESFAVTAKDGTVEDDHGFTITINAGEVNSIEWMIEGSNLQLGTASATRSISPSEGGELSPTNVKQKRESSFGSDPVKPVLIGSATLYAGIYGEELREMVYSFESDSFITPDASVLSEHLLTSGIRQMTYVQSPNSIVWACLNDGSLISLTYERDQRTVGWVQHEIGGDVESVASIPGADRHELWMIVKRTINGQTKRYIERLRENFDSNRGSSIADYAFLDCQVRYDGVVVSALPGVDHLEGETVGVVADGVYIGSAMVASGIVTLPLGRTASKVTIGLLNKARGQTLPPPLQGKDGSLKGRHVMIKNSAVSFMDMVDMKVGTIIDGADQLQTLFGDGFTDDMLVMPDLREGVKKVDFPDSWENQAQMIFEVDTPYPCLIRSFTGGFEFEP